MNLETKRVAVIGAGLAGLSAACALADSGLRVTLFERKPFLGGRASSYQHPGTGEVIDNCQHVLLGCCTNLMDFYKRIGAVDKITWFDRLHFIEPGGRCSTIGPSWLPAPFHSAPSFLAASFLDAADKDCIARALMRFSAGLPADSEESFLAWLERHGQTSRAIARFWKPVLVSALNEELGRASVHYAAQVFRESFLKSAAAGHMGVPRVPLTELYDSAASYIESRAGEVRCRSAVEALQPTHGITLKTANGMLEFDAAVLAVPCESLAELLPRDEPSEPLRAQLAQFEHSPITGIHLWLDRVITDLPHAVLLDRTVQWLFHKSQVQRRPDAGSYVELVVSASRSLVEKSRQEIIDLALAELAEFFPAAHDAKLLKAAVVKEVHATFSVQPLSDSYRPSTATPWPNIFLAGDWMATGWPATMEGAVRGGYTAAQAVTRLFGKERTFLVPDLPAQGMMKVISALR